MLRCSLASTPFSDALFLYDIEALSLAYGFYPNLEGAFSKKSQYVMFVDMGYEHTTVFVTHFCNGKFIIIYSSTSLSLSSRWIDQILVSLTEEKLRAHNITQEVLKENKRMKAEIRSHVEKQKVIFSNENADQIAFFVTVSATDQVDVVITHKEFQNRCRESGLLQELTRLCKNCLEVVNGVDIAILEGSGTRLAIISNLVKILLQDKKYERQGVLQ